MITFKEVKEMFKKSIDDTDTMNQALENLIQSIYLKGYNEALEQETVLNKIRAEIEEVQTYDGIYIDRAYVLEILDKYKAENEG